MGKKVSQIFNPRPGRGSNRGPQDWEAEIFTTVPTPPLIIIIIVIIIITIIIIVVVVVYVIGLHVVQFVNTVEPL